MSKILCPSVDTSRAVQRSISHFRTQTPCSMSLFSKRTEREDFFERLTRCQNPHSGSLCCYLYSILTLNLTLNKKLIKWNDLAPCWSNCHGGVDQTGGVYKGGASNARLKGQRRRLFERGRLLDHLRYWTGGTNLNLFQPPNGQKAILTTITDSQYNQTQLLPTLGISRSVRSQSYKVPHILKAEAIAPPSPKAPYRSVQFETAPSDLVLCSVNNNLSGLFDLYLNSFKECGSAWKILYIVCGDQAFAKYRFFRRTQYNCEYSTVEPCLRHLFFNSCVTDVTLFFRCQFISLGHAPKCVFVFRYHLTSDVAQQSNRPFEGFFNFSNAPERENPSTRFKNKLLKSSKLNKFESDTS